MLRFEVRNVGFHISSASPILFVYKNLTAFREQETGDRPEFQFFYLLFDLLQCADCYSHYLIFPALINMLILEN